MRLLIFVGLLCSFAFTSIQEKHSLTIKVSNVKDIQGKMFFALYDKASDFPKEGRYTKRVSVKVSEKTVSYTFEGLDEKDYAIAVFHDKNGDGKCNLNFFGVPTEGYGFSKNFKPVFSAPKFDDVKVRSSEGKQLEIKLLH